MTEAIVIDGEDLVLPDTPLMRRVRGYAPGLSSRYFGCPVFLVGGALLDPDPRDVDLIVPIPDDVFVAAYGALDEPEHAMGRWCGGSWGHDPPEIWRRWARDRARQSRELTLGCCRAIDFRTWPETQFYGFDDGRRPRLRIDCRFMPAR